jgi:hypothetical protein
MEIRDRPVNRRLGERSAREWRGGEEGDRRDVLALAKVHHVIGSAVGEVVAVLHRRDRDHGPCTLDLVHAHLGDADVPDAPRVAVLPEDAQRLLEGHLGVDPMQVVKGDGVGVKSFEALLDLSPQSLRPTAAPFVAGLGSDHQIVREWGQRAPDGPLACSGGIEVGRVDEVHSGVDGPHEEVAVLWRVREPVGAEPDPFDRVIREGAFGNIDTPAILTGPRPTCGQPAPTENPVHDAAMPAGRQYVDRDFVNPST